MTDALQFQDPQDSADLTAFLSRAKKLDQDGAVRLKAFGDVLACYVAPIYSGALVSNDPTVLGLRTLKLGAEANLDGTFDISSILERLARSTGTLEIPPAQVRVPWSGILPPRQGWLEVTTIDQAQITEWAKAGIAEVATSLPESVGASIANKVRLQVWGRSVEPNLDLPAGAAFALSGLGFMTPGGQVAVYSAQNWLRLSTQHGHVLTRRSPKL